MWVEGWRQPEVWTQVLSSIDAVRPLWSVVLSMSFQTSCTRTTGFNLLEMHVLSPHPRPSALETLCLRYSDLHFEKPS